MDFLIKYKRCGKVKKDIYKYSTREARREEFEFYFYNEIDMLHFTSVEKNHSDMLAKIDNLSLHCAKYSYYAVRVSDGKVFI